MCISQYLNSNEQPCTEEEQYDSKRCMDRLFAMSVPADTEVLDTLGVRSFQIKQREKIISKLSFIYRNCTTVLKL